MVLQHVRKPFLSQQASNCIAIACVVNRVQAGLVKILSSEDRHQNVSAHDMSSSHKLHPAVFALTRALHFCDMGMCVTCTARGSDTELLLTNCNCNLYPEQTQIGVAYAQQDAGTGTGGLCI